MPKIEFETYWVGGYEAVRRAQSLAEASAEAVHTLNYATMATSDALAYPSHAGHIVGGIRSTVGYMPQLFEQLSDFLGQGIERMYDDRGDSHNPRETAQSAQAILAAAAEQAERLVDTLSRAQTAIDHLGVRDDFPERLETALQAAETLVATAAADAGLPEASVPALQAWAADRATEDVPPVPGSILPVADSGCTCSYGAEGYGTYTRFPAAGCSADHPMPSAPEGVAESIATMREDVHAAQRAESGPKDA